MTARSTLQSRNEIERRSRPTVDPGVTANETAAVT